MRAFVSVLVTATLALPLGAATLEVRVTTPSGAVAPDAVVYAVPAVPVSVGHRIAYMDQRNRTFVPHVLPVQTGTWVEFPNSDNIRHQVYSTSPAKRFQLPLYTGKPAFPVQFDKPGVVELGCNIHPEMSAFIVVVDTPFFATTDGGHAVLDNLGPGKYTIHVWYPGMRVEPDPKLLTLEAGDHPTVSFVAG